MTTLLLADFHQDKLLDTTAKTLSAARALGEPVHILIAGKDPTTLAGAAARLEGAAEILVADSPIYEHRLAEPLAELLCTLAPSYSTFIGSATSSSKNVMPRLAALLDVMQVSEITGVISFDTFERPIYAGNAVQTVQTRDARRVITVRTAAFPAAAESSATAPIRRLATGPDPGLSRFVGEAVPEMTRPELTAAKIIVSGGRAMQSAANFGTYLAPLADRLGAAIGASRAAVDAGFAPNDWQVGQTGKVVAPDLYIAIGISGAIQHLAGMKDSKVIVAINKDAEAPIFQVADYGLVQDLFTALPELQKELDKIEK